jgi:hypothetical protein
MKMNSMQRAENDEMVPLKFHLSQNYPNPFEEKTTIKYCVAYKTLVAMTIYNSEGEFVKKLVNEEQEAGTYEVEFSTIGGSASGGNALDLPSGVYFYQLKAGEYINTNKMILLR